VNRSKYSNAADVLFTLDGQLDSWGVAACAVGNLPQEVPFRAVEFFQIQVLHTPKPSVYAHSEITAWREVNGWDRRRSTK